MPLPTTLIGLGLGLAGSLLGKGKKPKLTLPPPPDTAAEQRGAIAGNIKALPSAKQLASETNRFSQEELLNALKRAMPYYEDITRQQASAIQAGLRGELPEDVQRQIQRMAAASAYAGGFAGSGLARNLLARNLGLASLQLSQQALEQANAFLRQQAALTVPPQMNIASMFISPLQRIENAMRIWQMQSGAALDQAMINAAPDPMMSSLASFIGGVGGMMARGGLFGNPTRTQTATPNININPATDTVPLDNPYMEQLASGGALS